MNLIHFVNDFSTINGISQKTLNDIKLLYSPGDEDKLIKDLIENNVPLREDIVLKLRKYYDLY